MSFSYWEHKEIFENIDFAILGAGIVGSFSALFLREKFPSANILVLDRGVLPQGASTKNAGFACFGSVGEILDDLTNMTESEIIQLIKLRIQGLKLLRKHVPEEIMDFHQWGGYEVFDNNQTDIYESKINQFNGWVEEASGLRNTFALQENNFGFGFGDKHIFNQYEGQLNPVKMLRFIHRKLIDQKVKILFGSNISNLDFDQKSFQLNLSQTVFPNNIIICTNAFSNQLLPNIDLVPARNQVIVSQPIAKLPFKGTFHYDKGYVYFRNIGNRILIGGARNIDLEKETSTEFTENDKIIQHLKDMVQKFILPGQNLSYDYQWTGIIATGQTKEPIVQEVKPGIFAAIRLGGMGVAIGSKVAQEVTKLIDHNRLLA